MAKATLEMWIMEYKELRSDISEIQKIPEKWAKIMLPLSAGILAVAVNSMKSLNSIGVDILVILSISTIAIWLLIVYDSVNIIEKIIARLRTIENKIYGYGGEILEMQIHRIEHSVYPFLNQKLILLIFSSMYMMIGIAIIYVNHFS